MLSLRIVSLWKHLVQVIVCHNRVEVEENRCETHTRGFATPAPQLRGLKYYCASISNKTNNAKRMSNPVTFSSQSRYSFIQLEEIKETASGQEFRLPMNIDFVWRESTEMLYCVALLDMERKRNIWTPITLPVYTKRKNCPKSTHFSWVAGCLFCICCHFIAGLHRQRERNNGGINRKTVWLVHVWTGQCVRGLGQILYMNSLSLSCYFSVK